MIHYVRRSANQHFGSTIKMKFNVTNIAYDFNDGNADLSDDYKVTLEEMRQITEDTIGVWEADNEDDLIEEITSASGWCIQNIDYEIQLK